MSQSEVQAATPEPIDALTSFFVSYAREDLAFRVMLQKALESAGRRVWVDERMAPLTNWREEVLAAIVGADVFVFVLSPDSLVSEACLNELTLARESSKRIAPIVWRDVEGLPLPPGLGDPNWIFFLKEDVFDSALIELLKAADTDLEWVKTHTRLALRAKDWSEQDRDESLVLRGRDLEKALAWLAQAATPGHGEASPAQADFIEASRAREADENARLREQYSRAVARQLAFQSELERGSTPRSVEISALLAAESIACWRTNEGDHALRRAMAQLPLGPSRTVAHEGGEVLALGRDGSVLAVAKGKKIEVWEPGNDSPRLTLTHSQSVVSLTLDDDETLLLGVNDKHSARLWSLTDGSLLRRVKLSSQATHIALYPGSQTIAATTVDGTIAVFQPDRASAAHLFDVGHDVRAIALANEASLLVAVCLEGNSGLLRVFDSSTGEPWEPYPLDGYVRRATFAPGAAYLAATIFHVGPWMGPDRDIDEVTVQSLSDLDRPSVKLRHPAPVRAFGFTGDGEHVYTVTDRAVALWRALDGQPVGAMPRDSDPRHLAYDATTNRLAVASVDGVVRVGDIVADKPVMALDRQADGVAFNAAGSLVVSEPDRTEIWPGAVGFEMMRARPGVAAGSSPEMPPALDVDVPAAQFYLQGLNADMHGFSPDGSTLLVEGPDNLLTLLDTKERVVRVISAGKHSGHSAFSADSRHVITVSTKAAIAYPEDDLGDSRVRVRRCRTGDLVAEYDRPDSPHYQLNERRGRLAHASTDGDRVWVRDSLTGEQTHHVRLPYPVAGLQFSDAGDHLAIGTEDQQLRILSLVDDELRDCGSIENYYVSSLRNDGRFAVLARMPHYDFEYAILDVDRSILLAAGDDLSKARELVLASNEDRVAVLLEQGGADIRTLPSLEVVHRLDSQPTLGLAFLDDGHLVTVQDDNTMHVWHIDDGSEVMPPLEHPDETRTPFVDPSGRLIATGCNDGWVRIYQWRVEDLVAEARARVDHELDDKEIERLHVEYLEERARETAVPQQRSRRRPRPSVRSPG